MAISAGKIQAFLKDCGMSAEFADVPALTARFREEMRDGLAGRGPLYMVPTYIGEVGAIEYGRPVAVLDVGGTNLRSAVVTFDRRRGAVISDYSVRPTPGVLQETDPEGFFSELAEAVAGLPDAGGDAAVCFSFGSKPLPDRDGEIFEAGKQLKVKGLIGRRVGRSINEQLRRRGFPTRRFVVLNDSVAVLLSGAAQPSEDAGRAYAGTVGFVLGTGVNLCYYERSERIPKLPAGPRPARMIINTEAGMFDGAPRGRADLAMDASLKDPGRWQMEKMVSGRYQGPLLRELFRQAGRAGLLSPHFASAFAGLELTGPQIDEFLDEPDGGGALALCCGRETAGFSDVQTVRALIENQAERAARILTAALGAVLQAGRGGKDPNRPVRIATEGSTFFRSRALPERLKGAMHTFVEGRLGIRAEFARTEHATLAGSAAAVFTD